MNIMRDLIVLDLETTGLWVEKDRIIEIAMIKVSPEGERHEYVKRVNPGMPIPAIVTELTGIGDDDVRDAPSFKEIAQEVLSFIGDADLSGFNAERFDLPLLQRELYDAGLAFDWQTRTIYDAQKIYHYHEKRDLSAAYKFYCDKHLADAHSAFADAHATLEILEEQVARYGDGSSDLTALANAKAKKVDTFFDKDRKFKWWNGQLYPTFGKYARRVSIDDLATKDPKYLQWMLQADFSDEIKNVVRAALSGDKADPPVQKTLL